MGDYAKAFDALEKANQKRVTDGNLKSKSWREQFDRISLELTSWKPIQFRNSSSHKKLLVILGPSRSGKTTLERILCNDHSFFRGFEGCRASLAVNSLRKLAEETRQNPKDENDNASVLWEILFPTHVETLDRPEYRLHTITDPFLLPAVPAMADVYEGAYFIFVVRNRIDYAAEIFAKDYADKPSYAYQAVTALEYVDRYYEMSTQLSIKLGNRAIEISFDQIIQSPTRVLNDVYTFVGLKPSPGVIDGVVSIQNSTSASPFRVQFAELLSG